MTPSLHEPENSLTSSLHEPENSLTPSLHEPENSLVCLQEDSPTSWSTLLVKHFREQYIDETLNHPGPMLFAQPLPSVTLARKTFRLFLKSEFPRECPGLSPLLSNSFAGGGQWALCCLLLCRQCWQSLPLPFHLRLVLVCCNTAL